MCVLIFSTTLFETFLILRINERNMIKNVYWLSYEVTFIFVRFKCLLNFIDRYSKNTKIWNFMKIRPVGTELFRVDRRTDGQTDRHDEANSRFWQFCERV
jgi:hypothetical protein